MNKISVVINTLNDEGNIERVINSLKWAQEIIVCDMYSEDKTQEIAKKMGAKVFLHKRLQFVEPARNFAISKATSEYILILDPDEEVPQGLAQRLQEIAQEVSSDYVRIPRKNIIFGKWVRSSGWWPDFNIRFFKKGAVKWTDKIHRPPQVSGQGLDLLEKEELAIIHYNYETISQYLTRMNRYTQVQAEELKKDGYSFDWKDLIKKPLSEFLSRFFAARGFEDGLHGLALSLLQAFSFLIMYLRVWEIERFTEQKIAVGELREITKEGSKEITYWFKYGNLSKNPIKRFFQKVKNNI